MKHIIIVSRDDLLSDVVSYSIRHSSLEVSVVASPEGLYRESAKKPACVVIFLELAPYFTSYNILTRLKALWGHIPIIYVINEALGEHVVLSLLEAGVNQYLTFPLDTTRLRHKVLREMTLSTARQ